MAETKASEGSPDLSHARLCTKWCTAALAIPYPIIPGTTTSIIIKFTHFYVPNSAFTLPDIETATDTETDELMAYLHCRTRTGTLTQTSIPFLWLAL